MSRRELDAAGITEPALRASYERCRRLNAAHGRTYFLATRLLPAAKRPYVHALYGFARYADEFVDSLVAPDPAGLERWSEQFLGDWDRGDSRDAVAAACLDTARRWDLPRAYFEAFLDSMQQDIRVTSYATYADLEQYMYGSAAVIGLMMLPLLEPADGAAGVHAARLGEAFQLTNFIRDVGEDLLRGRVYLPSEDLDAFGVSREDLAAGRVTPPIRQLLQFEVARARSLYAAAEPGIGMLHPASRDCIRTAFTLYGEILDAVEHAGYDVLRRRASVPMRRRAAVAATGLLRAHRARRVQHQTV